MKISLLFDIMKLIFIILTLFVLASGKKQNEQTAKKEYKVDVSRFLDRAMPYISKFIVNNKLDPLNLPNTTCSFWMFHPVTIVHKATLGLSSGELYSLSKLYRNSKAIVTYKNKQLSIDTSVGFNDLLIFYDYYIKLRFTRPAGFVSTHAKSIKANIAVKFDLAKYKLNLEKLSINKIGKIKVDLAGNPAFDWIVKPISNVIVTIFKKRITRGIESKATVLIQKYFNEFSALFPRH